MIATDLSDNVTSTHLTGACQLNSSPLAEGGPASCEGPCRASSSIEGRNSLAGAGVEPYCWVDTGAHPVWVQAPIGVLNLVKDPVEPGAGGTAGFVMPGCAADVVAAAATAAVASGAAPKKNLMQNGKHRTQDV